jgi:hypothetical protein
LCRAHNAVWAIYGANKGDGEAAAKGETQQAKNAIQACVDAGIGHIVYSTLDGGLGAKHWDSKQAGEWGVSAWLGMWSLLSSIAVFLFLCSSAPLLIPSPLSPPVHSSLPAVLISIVHVDLSPPSCINPLALSICSTEPPLTSPVSKWAVAHNLPVTNLYMTFYFSNITRAGLVTPKDDGSGSFVLGIPAPDGTVVPGVAPEQTGVWVEKILSSPGEYKGA